MSRRNLSEKRKLHDWEFRHTAGRCSKGSRRVRKRERRAIKRTTRRAELQFAIDNA